MFGTSLRTQDSFRKLSVSVVVAGFVDLRASSDVAYLSLREDCGVDRFDGVNSFPRAKNVLIEGKRGKINYDRIEPGPRRLNRFRQ